VSAKPSSLLMLVVLVFVCAWAGEAHAARWEDHRAAALRAVDEIDYQKAIEQFEAAIYYAQEMPAAGRDIAGLWGDLTAAYFADERYRRVWDAIARWDKVLIANAGQPWVREQQTMRDRMTRLLFERTREASAEGAGVEQQSGDLAPGPTDPPAANSSLALAPAEGPTEAPAEGPTEAPAEGPTEAPAELTIEPGRYGIHLASFSNEANALSGWAALKARYPDHLNSKTYALRLADLGDRGIFVRLIAWPFPDSASARAVCADLQRRAQYCAVTRPG
jgi:hypothetical protein